MAEILLKADGTDGYASYLGRLLDKEGSARAFIQQMVLLALGGCSSVQGKSLHVLQLPGPRAMTLTVVPFLLRGIGAQVPGSSRGSGNPPSNSLTSAALLVEHTFSAELALGSLNAHLSREQLVSWGQGDIVTIFCADGQVLHQNQCSKVWRQAGVEEVDRQ